MVEVKRFHWADYLVFGIFLTVSAGIGFFFGWRDRKKTSVKEFLTGGKKMHWIPVALSMQASFLSAIFILSTPVEFYYFGTTYYYLFLTYIVALPISAHMFLSVFYKMNLLSAYEYLEVRFNKPVRIAGASTFCLMMILYMPVVLYTPAIALAQVTGLQINISILLCGSICTLYTFLGGMKATVWNDFLQMVVIIAGLFCIVIIGTLKLGGIERVWEINEEGGRIILDDFRIDPTIRTTFWTQFVGGSYVSFSLYTSSQTIIQKFLSVRSLKDAYKSIYLDVFTSFLFITLVALVGILCYAFYATCDPLSANRITKSDQLVPLLVMEVLSAYPGLPGLFIATTFSAALSSLSGGLNALSAVVMTDFICPLYNWRKGEQVKERSKTILSKALVFSFGVFSVGSGYLAQFAGDSILQISISIFGFVGGPLTALLVLGVCFPFVNCWGAFSGLVMSLAISSWMAIGSILSKIPLPKLEVSTDGCMWDNFTSFPFSNGNFSIPPPQTEVPWFYRISHFYYAPISLLIAVVIAIPISLITGPAKNTDPELIVDWGKLCFRKCQKLTVTEFKIPSFGQVVSEDSKSDFQNSACYGDNELTEENYLKNRKLIYSTKF